METFSPLRGRALSLIALSGVGEAWPRRAGALYQHPEAAKECDHPRAIR
jgi:hypothetical protein